MTAEPSKRGRPRARGAFLAQLRASLHALGLLDGAFQRVSVTARRALERADGSEWVDEADLLEVLRVVRWQLGFDEEGWRRLVRDETRRGVSRFGRLFLRCATLPMVLAMLPRAWAMTHDTGRVTVRWEGRRPIVEYRDFAPLAAPEYQALTVAVLEAVLELNRTRAAVVPLGAEYPEVCFAVALDVE